ncbi:hypothetical protein GGS23DRAFT_494488 [Durotheca rogersii]|uniref:uncharacterized protein n=1 Tax=Durotheca rogersii TaxID=419775 RepID=UPI0022211A58|nr:uncharacterized protein GGS23DRAFT_494488 [Durotheca rogersii]KAI5864328.1 hypothetical protein GGS23DRAFT_494488 [Durotheca rogersii]
MRILSRIDGSIHGAILLGTPPPGLSSVSQLSGVRVSHGSGNVAWRAFFAVVGRCRTADSRRKHGISSTLTSTRHISFAIARPDTRSRRLNCSVPNPHTGHGWNRTLTQEARSRSELLDIVDQYDDTTVEEHLEFLRDPYLRRYAPADGPVLRVSDRIEDVNLDSVDPLQWKSPEEEDTILRLQEAVRYKLRRPGTSNLDEIFEIYQELPAPRVSLITASLRHQLLAALAITEKKNTRAMLRYFAVVTDVRNSGFALTRPEWNTAISFASRYVGRSAVAEVEAALELWREMENVSGVRASEVTFNILFDVASKAGKFLVAEMLYDEMLNRGYSFNRYHHVSLIHYFGLKLETSGVRAAYKKMIESGEFIDTTVLNCVISAFLRSGERESAERVYNKMKKSDRRSKWIPARDYTTQKAITKVLMMFAKLSRRHPDLHANFHQATSISPDIQTYRILINYYGIKLGDLSTVVKLLDEMKWFRIQLHGSIFLALFKSFGKFGGLGSDWSAQKLRSVWKAYIDSLDSKADGLEISTWMVAAVLKAFSRYSSRDEMLDVYEDMRSRWDLEPEGSRFAMHCLRKILRSRRFDIQSIDILRGYGAGR